MRSSSSESPSDELARPPAGQIQLPTRRMYAHESTTHLDARYLEKIRGKRRVVDVDAGAVEQVGLVNVLLAHYVLHPQARKVRKSKIQWLWSPPRAGLAT